MYLLVTGCRGFFGHHLTGYLLQKGYQVLGVDAETYAAIHPVPSHKHFRYVKADIAELEHLPDVDAIVNLAAETHVDNSLMDAGRFLHSNIIGVHRLLELVRGKRQYQMPLFLQVSTDEVLGPSLFPRHVSDPMRPGNPYSASKAAAEHLIESYHNTYQVPFLMLRPTNLYGDGQYPEKLIPKAIRSIAREQPMPIHGDGSAKRSWLSVQDACNAVEIVLTRGKAGHTYHAGGNTVATVKDVVRAIGAAMGIDPLTYAVGKDPVAEYEYQRPGMDISYSLDDSGTRALGWEPTGNFFRDLPHLVALQRTRMTW